MAAVFPPKNRQKSNRNAVKKDKEVAEYQSLPLLSTF